MGVAAVVEHAEAAVMKRRRRPDRPRLGRVAESSHGVERHARDDARVEFAGAHARELCELGTAGVSMLAEIAVQPLGAEVARRVDPLAAERVHRPDVRLRRVGVAEAHRPADHVAQLADVAVGSRHEVRAPPAVGVAHRQRRRFPVGALEDPDMREIGVPRRVERAAEQVLDLVLVAVVVAGLEVEPLLGEPAGELVPDLLDRGVVHDGAQPVARHQKSSWPVMALPRKSRSSSVVGAITAAARASRRWRSSGPCLE